MRRVLRRGDRDLLALPPVLALFARVDARDDFDERGLPRAVVADEANDLAGHDVEVNAVQRTYSAESLRDPPQVQQGGGLRHLGLSLSGFVAYWMPAALQPAANCPAQISEGFQKPS